MTKKTANRRAKYKKLRAEYFEEHPSCEVCGSPAHDIHHKRGRDGDNLFNDFLAVCRTCHDIIEANPDWARAKGYTLSRLHGN